jgi:hypothetical protein
LISGYITGNRFFKQSPTSGTVFGSTASGWHSYKPPSHSIDGQSESRDLILLPAVILFCKKTYTRVIFKQNGNWESSHKLSSCERLNADKASGSPSRGHSVTRENGTCRRADEHFDRSQPHALPNDHLLHLMRSGSQSEANPEFASSVLDRKGDQTIDADSG